MSMNQITVTARTPMSQSTARARSSPSRASTNALHRPRPPSSSHRFFDIDFFPPPSIFIPPCFERISLVSLREQPGERETGFTFGFRNIFERASDTEELEIDLHVVV